MDNFHKTAKFINLSCNTRKSTILQIFCNPKIPALGYRQSRNSKLAKTARILELGIQGLQSLELSEFSSVLSICTHFTISQLSTSTNC